MSTKATERRLRRLERVSRLQTVLLALATTALLTAAARSPQTLRAAGFELVDEQGRVAAKLELREGQPGLYLLDGDGVERVAVFHETDASGMYVSDADAVTRIGVAQFAHGGGGFALHGPQSRGAAVLYLKESASLRFFDRDGNVTRAIRAEPD